MMMTLQVVTCPNGQAEATLQNVQIKIPVVPKLVQTSSAGQPKPNIPVYEGVLNQ